MEDCFRFLHGGNRTERGSVLWSTGVRQGFLFQRRISRFIWIEENPDKASLQPDVRKVIWHRSGPAYLKAGRPELRFQFSYKIRISVPVITEILWTHTGRDTQIIHLMKSMVSVITEEGDALPEEKLLPELQQVQLLLRFWKNLALKYMLIRKQSVRYLFRKMNTIRKRFSRTRFICQATHMPKKHLPIWKNVLKIRIPQEASLNVLLPVCR